MVIPLDCTDLCKINNAIVVVQKDDKHYAVPLPKVEKAKKKK